MTCEPACTGSYTCVNGVCGINCHASLTTCDKCSDATATAACLTCKSPSTHVVIDGECKAGAVCHTDLADCDKCSDATATAACLTCKSPSTHVVIDGECKAGAACTGAAATNDKCLTCVIGQTTKCSICKDGYENPSGGFDCSKIIEVKCVDTKRCATCGPDADTCVSCKTGYANEKGKCADCATGYRKDGSECKKKGLNGGAIAGIVIAVLVVVAAACAGAYYFLKMRGKRAQAAKGAQPEVEIAGGDKPNEQFGADYGVE